MAGTLPTDRVADTLTLNTAVVLTTSDLQGAHEKRQVGPLAQVGGLTLFMRALLTLQRAGFSEAVVLAGDDEAELKQLVREDRRVSLSIRWRPVREFPPTDPRTWEALAHELNGACLIVSARTIFSRSLVEHLRAEVSDGHVALVVRGEDGEAAMAAVSPSLLSVSSVTGSADGAPLRALLERAEADGRVKSIPIAWGPAFWCQTLKQAADMPLAERTLIRSLQGQFEGLIDTYFNRKISALLSRLFLAMGLSPNAITVVATAIGLLAAVAFAMGHYAAGVIGALLFQLAAIVDCCDGEVARLTFRESKLGEQLDIMTDNVVHVAIFGAIGWGSFLAQGGWQNPDPLAWLPLALGGAAIFANAVSLWLVMRAKSIDARSGWTTSEQAIRVTFILKNMASRDFSVVLLLFALIGKLDWFLALAAVGSNVFWLMLAWVTRPSTIARA